jgi:hypothetical protein
MVAVVSRLKGNTVLSFELMAIMHLTLSRNFFIQRGHEEAFQRTLQAGRAIAKT